MDEHTLMGLLLVILAILNGLIVLELRMSRRACKEFIDRGYKNGEDG